MFQEIEPHVYCNDFALVEPESSDTVLIYRGDSVLVSVVDGLLSYPTCGAFALDSSSGASVFLFSIDSHAFFLAEIDDDEVDAFVKGSSYSFFRTGALHAYGPQENVFAGMMGYTYYTWYDTRRYCGRCATPLVHDATERMMRCPSCGCMEFPKLFPAVIVGIVDPSTDRVLVSRYANREFKSYALIAGFAEMGETIEQTVHREVMEEVGLRVKNLAYYTTQPWPVSSSLLFGFFCELDGDSSLIVDHHELEDAEWILREELPCNDENYSLTRDMMRVLRERREGDFAPLAADNDAERNRSHE